MILVSSVELASDWKESAVTHMVPNELCMTVLTHDTSERTLLIMNLKAKEHVLFAIFNGTHLFSQILLATVCTFDFISR